jgi:hypothetical protein
MNAMTIDAQEFGMYDLDSQALESINGGDGFWVKVGTILVTYLIENAGSVAQGAQEGWNAG